MTAPERQELIAATLRRERRATVANLASAFGCSERTIRYDIEALSVSGFPVVTIQGRHGGGVELMEGYRPQSPVLSPEQIIALREVIKETTDPLKRMTLGSILDQFSPSR